MKQRFVVYAVLVFTFVFLGWSVARAAQGPKPPYPTNATFSTRITTPLQIEGLTGRTGKLYTVGRNAGAGVSCPVWEIDLLSPSLVVVGNIPAPSPTTQCSPSGLAFGPDGFLYITNGDKVSYLLPDANTPPTANDYATNTPGANGVAFKGGDLWISDGTTGLGRVWKVAPGGGDCTPSPMPQPCEEIFRIQPMNNGSAFEGLGPGVGRVNSTLQGTSPNNPNPQNLVANGLAFNLEGNLLISDTARGAIWLARFDKQGNLVSKQDCDHTFVDDTLCLENLVRADPRLEGIDGIALDNSGNIWASVNERNAIVFTVFYGTSNSVEVFRNPVNPDNGRRNSSNTDNTKILESPTSPFLLGTTFCTANSDFGRRDNFPFNEGEINGTGKISCMDQELGTSGLPLPRP